MNRTSTFLLFFSFPCLVLIAQSPQRQLIDYYDGRLSLSADSARSLALSVNHDQSSSYHRALASFMMGYWHNQEGKKVSAAAAYLEALQHLNRADTADLYLEVNIRKNIGAILYTYELYNHAIRFYRQALPYASKYSSGQQASLWYNLGNAYERLDSTMMAFSSYEKSGLLEPENLRRQIQILNKKGMIEKGLERFKEAQQYYQQIIERTASVSEDFQFYRAKAFHNLGVVYRLQREYQLAIPAFRSAIAIDENSQKFISFKDLGEVYLQQAKRELAIGSWTQAEAYYPEMPLHPDHFGLFKLISTVYESNDPLHLAYWKKYTSALEQYQTESDEIKRIAAKSYMGSLVSRYYDEVSEYEAFQARLWTGGVFLAGVISALLSLLGWQWWHRRKLARKVGALNGTIDEIETTLTQAIEAMK